MKNENITIEEIQEVAVLHNELYDRKVYLMVKQLQSKCWDEDYINNVWDFMFSAIEGEAARFAGCE